MIGLDTLLNTHTIKMTHAKLILKDNLDAEIESYIVDCTGVLTGFNNSVSASPYANGTTVTEAQVQSFDNPIYTLQNVLITERAGTLTYAKLLEYAKMRYTGDTNYMVLNVDYGGSTTSVDANSFSTTSVTYVEATTIDVGDAHIVDDIIVSLSNDIEGTNALDTVDVKFTFNYTDLTTSTATGSINVEDTTNVQQVSITNPNTTKTITDIKVEIKRTNVSGTNYLAEYVSSRIKVSNSKVMPDSAGATNGIKVVVKSFTAGVGLSTYQGVRPPTGNIILQETL